MTTPKSFLSHSYAVRSYAVDASFMFCSRWLFLHYNEGPKELQNSTTENLSKTLLKYIQPVQRKWNGKRRLLEEKKSKKWLFKTTGIQSCHERCFIILCQTTTSCKSSQTMKQKKSQRREEKRKTWMSLHSIVPLVRLKRKGRKS